MAPNPIPFSASDTTGSTLQSEFAHPHDSKNAVVYGGTIPVFVIASVFISMRIYYRAFPTMRLWWDDFFIVLAYIFEVANLAVSYAIADITGGRHIVFVSAENIGKGLELGFYLFILSPIVNCFIKISLCLMLLRIKKNSSIWRIGLWSLMIVTLLVTVANVVLVLLSCRPVYAFWHLDLALGSDCWSTEKITNLAIGFGAYFVVTDFIMALLPILFIQNIQMPLRNKIILSLLMAVGLLAMAAGIIKVALWRKAIEGVDFFYNLAGLEVWLDLELLIGIICACVPTLRAPFEKLLRRVGVLSTRQGSKSTARATTTNKSNTTRNMSAVTDGGDAFKSMNNTMRGHSVGSRASMDVYNGRGEKEYQDRQSSTVLRVASEEEEEPVYEQPVVRHGSRSLEAGMLG